jgi:hypothetical protein
VPVLAGLVELERDLGHVAADIDLAQQDDLGSIRFDASVSAVIYTK